MEYYDNQSLVSSAEIGLQNISGPVDFSTTGMYLHDYLRNVEIITEFYIKPVIYCIGIPGNILSLILWVQPRLRNSSGCYFAALSISDTIVLILHMVATLEKAGMTNFLVTKFLCEVFNVLYVSTECLSLLLVLGLTVDRFIIVCYPMKRQHLCTINRTMKLLSVQAFLSLIMGIVEGSFWTYSTSHHRCEPTSILSRRVYMEIGNILILTFGVILPAILVIVFNIIIIVNLHRTSKNRHKLCHMSSTASASSHHVISDTDATIMLLSICCYVILAEVPDEIAYLIQPFYPEGNTSIPVIYRETDPIWRSHYNFNITSSILSTFSMTNYAIDIFIYSLTGRRFREMAFLFLCCKVCGKDGMRKFRKPESIVYNFNKDSNYFHSHDTAQHSPCIARSGMAASSIKDNKRKKLMSDLNSETSV